MPFTCDGTLCWEMQKGSLTLPCVRAAFWFLPSSPLWRPTRWALECPRLVGCALRLTSGCAWASWLAVLGCMQRQEHTRSLLLLSFCQASSPGTPHVTGCSFEISERKKLRMWAVSFGITEVKRKLCAGWIIRDTVMTTTLHLSGWCGLLGRETNHTQGLRGLKPGPLVASLIVLFTQSLTLCGCRPLCRVRVR